MIDSHGLTDIGCVRQNNEDRILIDESLGLFIVADGMGGHTHGEMAAALGISSMQHYIGSSRDHLDVTWPFGYNFDLSIDANLMITAIQLANRQVWRQAEQAPEYAGMGTTIAAVLVTGDKVTVGSVGDSRVYLWRSGSLRQLTVDDTWVKAISGRSTSQVDVANHPLRNFLTQAAGSKDLIDVHVSELDLKEGDVILMSSDGLHGMVPDAAIASAIEAGESLPATAANLVQLAKAGGGMDNVSVILLASRS
jgi:serine/threonine protein phosphatase PrpC